MKNKEVERFSKRAVLIRNEDWEALYVDGQLVREGHTISKSLGDALDLIDHFKIVSTDFESYYIELDHFPATIIGVIEITNNLGL